MKSDVSYSQDSFNQSMDIYGITIPFALMKSYEVSENGMNIIQELAWDTTHL